MKRISKILLFAILLAPAAAIEQNAYANGLWNIQSGIQLVERQNYREALNFFEGYVQSNPNDSDGHYYLGLCYKHLGEMDKSAYHLQKSYELTRNLEKISIAPQTLPGGEEENSTENDYLDMANMYFDDGDMQKALQYAELIEKINPNNINGLILKTKIYYTKGDITLAGVYFKKALMIDNTLLGSYWANKLNIKALPEYNFDYYNTKGLEYYYSANPKTAIGYFKKALDLEQNATVYNNIAMCYIKLGNFQKAKEALNKAISADKNFNLTYINLAKLEEAQDLQAKKTGENKQREKYLQKAIKVNPNSKFAYLELGNYYLGNKDYNRSIQNFKSAILIDDSFYEAYMGLSRSYIETGNMREGIKTLRKATSLNPGNSKNPDMLYYMAKICISDGNFEEAKGYLLEAIEKSENANFYFELGKIYYNEEDYSSAKNAFNKAMELDLSFNLEGEIYNYYGLIEYKNFDTQRAVYMFKKATELEPNRAMYRYNLAQAYKSLGDKSSYSKEMVDISGISPKTVQDYLDFSTIYFDKKSTPMAIKLLDEGIAKYPDERALYEAKVKLCKACGDYEALKEAQNRIKTKFGTEGS